MAFGLGLPAVAREATQGGANPITFQELIDSGNFPLSGGSARPVAQDSEAVVFLCDDLKFVIASNDGGTLRYFTLDVGSTSGAWAHSTSNPCS
jgi:hypothetical protein